MGFTTNMGEMDIVYGSEEKLVNAIIKVYESVQPKAVFVYATCVSGLIGEDIEAVCKKAEKKLGIRVIPVNAPGFAGPKNLGNRIAGEVLLDYVIGTGAPPLSALDLNGVINIIGEYNIAGDLWLVEPVLKEAGINILSRITGDSTFEEITYAHRAKLNVVVCSRALINVAKEMERRYGIPYIEVSFFGKTEMSKAMRMITDCFNSLNGSNSLNIESIITTEEVRLSRKLERYSHLKGKKAVLYTGGVKSWSFISALMDLGIEIAAIGTKKSTLEDEEKMKDILGSEAPLVEDVTPKNLLRLLKEKNADILVAGGRNQYLAVKEGIPFVDVNQERHIPYAGYKGLINLAGQISNSIRFYNRKPDITNQGQAGKLKPVAKKYPGKNPGHEITINPLNHSQSVGAAIAFQGIHKALPIIHGAQGCSFLAKVLLTKHFREPVALGSTKLFTENVVMGSEEAITEAAEGFIKKDSPDVIGVLTTGLSEIKGDDVQEAVRRIKYENPACEVIHIPTPDYEGGIETGYSKAVETIIESIVNRKESKMEIPAMNTFDSRFSSSNCNVNVLAGQHLTPADFTELREITESFGLNPLIFPDLSALDGSRQGFSAIAVGGASVDEIKVMGSSSFTIAIGASMEPAARILKESFGIEYIVFRSISGLKYSDLFMKTLSLLGGRQLLPKYERQRRVLIDGMRDAHSCYGDKKICIALDPDIAIQTSGLLEEMGSNVELAVIPYHCPAADEISAKKVIAGDLFSIEGDFDLLISNSHAEDTAGRLGAPLYQTGFPVYKILGANSRTTIGYRGTLAMINEIANLMTVKH